VLALAAIVAVAVVALAAILILRPGTPSTPQASPVASSVAGVPGTPTPNRTPLPPTAQATPPATPAPASASAPAATAEPTAAPTATPGPTLPGPVAFITSIPPSATVAWTGLEWRALAADDPLAGVRSVVRWSGGFVAVGAPVATGKTSRTPLWISTDGASWHALDKTALGPSTIVIGIREVADGLVLDVELP